MKIIAEAVLREIAGDFVLVPTGSSVNDHNGLFSVSEAGARIWELIPECESEDDIVKAMLNEYDVDEETLRKDVSEFISSLKELGLVE